MPVERVRLDSTTSYGYHTITDDGLKQLGHCKDHRPELPQLKLMAAAAEPTGQLVACDHNCPAINRLNVDGWESPSLSIAIFRQEILSFPRQ